MVTRQCGLWVVDDCSVEKHQRLPCACWSQKKANNHNLFLLRFCPMRSRQRTLWVIFLDGHNLLVGACAKQRNQGHVVRAQTLTHTERTGEDGGGEEAEVVALV